MPSLLAAPLHAAPLPPESLICRARRSLWVLGLLMVVGGGHVWSQQDDSHTEPSMKLPKLGAELTSEQVADFASLALAGMHTEYPNKPSNVLAGPESVQSPKEMHPAFYGCFDWHSSVHGHWMLVRLLKTHPDHPLGDEIRKRLEVSLTAENLAGELKYFEEPQNKSFERMYGWAWYFRLVAELETWQDPQGRQWREILRPLEDHLVAKTTAYLPLLDFPIRTGIHPDTGFALGQTLDYARTVGNRDLEALVVQRGREYFLADTRYPTRYEPSGQDFFSSCLNEADFMRRVLAPESFVEWLDGFLPSLRDGDGGNLLVPVTVSDVTDGQLVHLAGLNLSRAWCMTGIASVLNEEDPRRQLLLESAAAHAAMGFRYVFSGHYEGEHWLATFAIYLQTGVGIDGNLPLPSVD